MATTASPRVVYAAPSPAILSADDATLARVRELFARVHFTFEELFRRSEDEKEEERAGGAGTGGAPDDATAIADACDVLRALFVAGVPLRWETVRERLGADYQFVADLGLLRSSEEEPQLCLGTLLICPIAELWLLADHPYVGTGRRMAPEVVYSPLTPNTQQFMLLTPRTPCDALLDLCAGSGIAALAAARLARTAVAADVTERSTHFAALNARLNGITNVETVQGDLYEPVAGRTFDRIVAHPPYMPAFESEYIFRDGGADGEQITRRVFEGLSTYLRPGGRCHVVCLATDRDDAPLEQRIRGWIGAGHEEFDVFVLELNAPRDPTEYYAHRAYDQGGGFADVEPRHRFFKEHQVKRLVYSAIVVERHPRPRAPLTARRRKGPLTAWPQIEWAVAFERVSRDPSLPARLLDLVPVPSPDLRMQLSYAPRSDGFALVDATLVVASPLAYDVDCPGWIPQFLERAVAPKTVRQHLAELVQAGIVDADVEPLRFAEALRDLASTGAIHFPGIEPPPANPRLAEVLAHWPAEAPLPLTRMAAESG